MERQLRIRELSVIARKQYTGKTIEKVREGVSNLIEEIRDRNNHYGLKIISEKRQFYGLDWYKEKQWFNGGNNIQVSISISFVGDLNYEMNEYIEEEIIKVFKKYDFRLIKFQKELTEKSVLVNQ